MNGVWTISKLVGDWELDNMEEFIWQNKNLLISFWHSNYSKRKKSYKTKPLDKSEEKSKFTVICDIKTFSQCMDTSTMTKTSTLWWSTQPEEIFTDFWKIRSLIKIQSKTTLSKWPRQFITYKAWISFIVISSPKTLWFHKIIL